MTNSKLIVATLTSIILSSCATPDLTATKDAVKNTKKLGNSISDQMSKRLTSSNISYSDSPFLGSKAFTVKDQIKPLPLIFAEHISLHASSIRI